MKLDIAFNFRRMYIKKTWIYGNRIEQRKYFASRYGIRGEKREQKKHPTEESIARANERAAEQRLMRLLVGNFDQGDHFLTLTYKKDARPTVEESKKILRRFFEKLRREYQRAGEDLKYIITTEWNGKSIHHHVVINDVPGFSRMISRLWPYGGQHYSPLYADYDYQGLAEYMIKETRETFRDKGNPFRQRYSCSRNLKKPIEKVEIIKAGNWKETPSVPPTLKKEGYILDIDSVVTGVDAFGYPFQAYTFIKRE